MFDVVEVLRRENAVEGNQLTLADQVGHGSGDPKGVDMGSIKRIAGCLFQQQLHYGGNGIGGGEVSWRTKIGKDLEGIV